MYDVEMMRMLQLIHYENKYIFEVLRSYCFTKEEREKITFDESQKEFERIMKGLEKYSACSECSYKNRFERIKNIAKEIKKEDELG